MDNGKQHNTVGPITLFSLWYCISFSLIQAYKYIPKELRKYIYSSRQHIFHKQLTFF